MAQTPKFTEEDRQVSQMIHQQLMNNKLTERDVYNMVESGQVSSGVAFLIGDYIDLGRLKANDFLDAYRAGKIGIKDGEFESK